MDHNDIRTLKILEEIDKGYHPSQRYLANELNVSLGLVNSFIKRLASKGYFKITTIPKNRVKYIITPKGIAEKSRLTYEYIKYSYQFYSVAKQELRKIYKLLEAEKAYEIVLYGVTDFAEIAYISCFSTRIAAKAVIDSEKFGERFFDLCVGKPDVLKQIVFDRILVTDLVNARGAISKIVSEGVEKEKIIHLNLYYPYSIVEE
jgi:DNA-binding MarR family transcriptional regulator